MVTPLGQRMVFQTAHSEAVRVANDIASQLQREDTFRKVITDRMAEDTENVRGIPKSDPLRTEERQENRRQSGNQSGEKDSDKDDDEPKEGAFFADGRLDFLA